MLPHAPFSELSFENGEYEVFRNLFKYLDETIGSQEEYFKQMQLVLIENSLNLFKAQIYNKPVTINHALIVFKESVFKKIELHEKPELFQGLSLAINDYYAKNYLIDN
ncbi:hypothetical protein [Solibacillus sp. FSL K6-1554]|uniref:hypothetical protein n=1 Tax=Solibacillus sp. FSL K6-1554 TaxID=2921472 RepID=UPI0030F4E806